MSLTDQFIEKAKKNKRRIVLPEGSDATMIQAASRLASEGIANPILLGAEEKIKEAAQGASLDGVEIVNPKDKAKMEQYSAAYAKNRDMPESTAARVVKRDLMFGAMMVSEGDADAMVAGISKATAQVISAASLAIGFEEGISQPSSFFLMVMPGTPERVLVFADCAVAIEPDAKGMAEIAVATARNARKLLDIEPRVAMLSFSTAGSASHPMVDKVREATAIARQLEPNAAFDGDIQADAAIVEKVAKKKCPDSPLKGDANVLVFPDLNAGNIGYKLVQRLAGAKAIGPVMQGFRRPVNDLSRGASVDDIIAVAAIASLQCGN